MKNTEKSNTKLQNENPDIPVKDPEKPTVPEPTIPESSPVEPDPYPVSDPIPEPNPEPNPAPPEPPVRFPPDVIF